MDRGGQLCGQGGVLGVQDGLGGGVPQGLERLLGHGDGLTIEDEGDLEGVGGVRVRPP